MPHRCTANDPLFANSWARVSASFAAMSAKLRLRDALLARYAEPHRRYHSLQHLAECLQHFETAYALAEHPVEVELALWFHDAIYETKSGGNEERSADWARDALLEAGIDPSACARVHSLVMATRHSSLPQTPDEQLLVDIDLSILGAEPARFAEYEQQIRAEYSFVPGFLFRRKRRAILLGFLDRPRLYGSACFHERLEAQARLNLAQAVAR